MLYRILIKAGMLFIAFNALYALIQPLPLLDRLTLYNHIFAGRDRFSWSPQPDQSFSVSLSRIDALLASHTVTGTPKAKRDYRVLFLGDSSIWGLEVGADGTAAACLDRLTLSTSDGKTIRAFNLGYPAPNALRDALIVQHALAYQPAIQPDLVVWSITLQSLNASEFALSDIVQTQADEAQRLAQAAGLTLTLPTTTLWDRTLFAQRSQLAAWLQHQTQAFAWQASRIDRVPYPFSVLPPFDLSAATGYEMTYTHDGEKMLNTAIDRVRAAGVPVLLVNEPIYISTGANSDKRYDADYPRWAFDQYRAELSALAGEHGWPYLDLWDAVPPSQFLRTSLHYTSDGACIVAKRIGANIQAKLAQP